ncbi:histidine kinase [Ligilactobacillus equi]|uniref:histidine kinase n=1 Tax=Ligilactobacillus equi TaxID=137357 RepID=UPI002ED389D6
MLDYYEQRWKIETYFYELKQFWSFGKYQVRSHQEVDNLNFLINPAYVLTKILPIIDSDFSALKAQGISARKNALSHVILEEQIFDSLTSEPQIAKNKPSIWKVLFYLPLKSRIGSYFL